MHAKIPESYRRNTCQGLLKKVRARFRTRMSSDTCNQASMLASDSVAASHGRCRKRRFEI